MKKMLRSLGFGLGLETFAKFLMISVSKNLVSEKKYRFRKIWYQKRSLGFGFRIFGLGKKVSVSEKFGLGKKSRFRFRKIWCWKKSLGTGFGKFGIGKKVSVSVLENLVSEKSLGIGFGQNFGIVIQCLKRASQLRDHLVTT